MNAVHTIQATKVSCGWIPTGDDKTINRTQLWIFFLQIKVFYTNNREINLVPDGTGYNRSQGLNIR
jgi:hypothetical protein